MNLTVVSSIMFLSFACCMAVAGWLASNKIDGWGWIIFVSLFFFGSINMRSGTDIAECPDCGKTFKIESEDSDGS